MPSQYLTGGGPMEEDGRAGEGDYELAGGNKKPIAWDDGLERVLDHWHRRVWAASIAHYRKASRLRRANVWVGLPVVVLSAVVGTSLFATLNEERLPFTLRVVVGAVSVGAAVLSAVQTFLAYGQQAEKHGVAGDWYAAIRRDIEEVRDFPRGKRGDARTVLRDIRRDMNKVGSQFPAIGEKEWARTAAEFGVEEPPRNTAGEQDGRHGKHRPGRQLVPPT
jgi:hypothetical protein